MTHAGKRPKFCAITHDILGDPFWEVFRRGLLDAAARYDVDVEHLRPGKFSPELQAGLIEAAVQARPDGLISTIPDVAAVDAPLHAAATAKIPLICINAADPRPAAERIPYLFYIGGDDRRAGRMAAAYLFARSGSRAALCVDHYMHEHICHNDRWHGFAEACREHGHPVERLRVPGEDIERSADAIADFLAHHPDVDAILTLGPPGAIAVPAAEEKLAGEGRRRHLTFDVSPLQIDGIRSGRIVATGSLRNFLVKAGMVASLFWDAAGKRQEAEAICSGNWRAPGTGTEFLAEFWLHILATAVS